MSTEGESDHCPGPGADRPQLAQRALAQMPDLRLVSALEICVDTHEHSLGNFGESPCLPTPAASGVSSLEPWSLDQGTSQARPTPLCPGTGDCHGAKALFFV